MSEKNPLDNSTNKKQEKVFDQKHRPEKKQGEVLGILTLTRHSKTNYTEKYPDLTDEGIEVAGDKAHTIAKRNKEKKTQHKRTYISSPNPRAQATADIIKTAIGDSKKQTRTSKSIRAMDFPNWEKTFEIFEELQGGKDDPTLVQRVYETDDRFENNPETIEPRSSVRKRAMRALEYLIRSFDKENNNDHDVPHIFATSHFEVINPIVADVFDLDSQGGDLFGHVEDVEITFLQPEDETRIPMIMKFRDMEKHVLFNRETREIEK